MYSELSASFAADSIINMKREKKTESDLLEEEMKLLIKKLNDENAALGKILLKMAEKSLDGTKPPVSAEDQSKSPLDSRISPE